MNRLMFQHFDFLLKLVYDVELVTFHLDKVLISLAKCLVGMWCLAKQSLILLGVQHVLDLIWKLVD